MTALGTLLFLVIGLAGVLSFSATMKWRDPHGSVQAVRGFRVPERFVPAVAIGLPFVELSLAVGLLLLPSLLFAIIAWLVFVLFATFTVLVGTALARGEAPECHCFGELSAEPISRVTVVRNLLLTVVALVVAMLLGTPGWPGLLAVISALSGDLLVEVTVLTAIALALALLWARQVRLRSALDAHEARIAERERADTTSAPDATPETAAIPEASLFTADGVVLSLRELPAQRAQLLVFLSPTCGHCSTIAARIPEWEAQLAPVISIRPVSVGDPDATAAAFPDTLGFLFDRNRTAMSILGSAGTPSAVLLGTNGMIGGGPANGASAIDAFIDGLLEAIALNRAQNTPMPEAETASEEDLPTFQVTPATTQAAWDDAELPSAELLREDGTSIDLRDAVARSAAGATPLVFWRSDCAYCESILPQMRTSSSAARTVLITTSDPASVRAQGIEGPLFVSPDRSALAAMQVPGTPVGFLVDGRHVVAGPFIGADAVRDLVSRG